MSDLIKVIKGSLSGKIILTTVILLIIGTGISWFLVINTFNEKGVNNAIEHASASANLITKSIHYSMLTKQRDAIQKTIEYISKEKDIEVIRIFDSNGLVRYSSKQEEIGRSVNRKSIICKGCHDNPERPSETLSRDKSWFIYNTEKGRKLTTVLPIPNEKSCYEAECHFHPKGQKILGILETGYSLSPVDKEINSLIVRATIYAIIFISISSLLLYLIFRRFVLNPISALSTAMKKVQEGDLNQSVDIRSEDEIGVLGNTFNMMTTDLKDAKRKAEEWTHILEEEVRKNTEELKKSQERLIQSEKLASLGRLTSDIAHEIRNPLTAIGGFARRLYKIVDGLKEKEYVGIMIEEVDRLEKILKDVLTFSRDARYNLTRQDIKHVIKEVVKLYEDLCMEHGIDLEVMLEENLPVVMIDKDQLRQALSNLLNNAIDAMPDGGALTITTDTERLHNVMYVVIKVSDTGKGIPEDKLDLIFEPFFSTKEVGMGTGLGLSITRKIMEEHGGFIDVKSTVGKGTTMSLYFPYQSIEESLKIKCWEYMKCGREKDSSMRCPAYPDFGRICWVVAGTFCEGKVQGTFAQKYQDCRKCEFYQRVKNKEI